jgi:hypothetical protein
MKKKSKKKKTLAEFFGVKKKEPKRHPTKTVSVEMTEPQVKALSQQHVTTEENPNNGS